MRHLWPIVFATLAIEVIQHVNVSFLADTKHRVQPIITVLIHCRHSVVFSYICCRRLCSFLWTNKYIPTFLFLVSFIYILQKEYLYRRKKQPIKVRTNFVDIIIIILNCTFSFQYYWISQVLLLHGGVYFSQIWTKLNFFFWGISYFSIMG